MAEGQHRETISGWDPVTIAAPAPEHGAVRSLAVAPAPRKEAANDEPGEAIHEQSHEEAD